MVRADMFADRFYVNDVNIGGHGDDDDDDDELNEDDHGKDITTAHRCHSAVFSWSRQTQ